MFHDDDDFMDEYFEYKMFENSMKRSESRRRAGQSKPTSPPPIRMTKPSSDLGCGGWIILICIVIVVISIFGSCGKSSHKSYSSGSYRSSYSTSSYSSSSRSSYSSSSRSGSSSSSKPVTGSRSYSGSKSKSKSSSSDPYDAKSYAHPDDLYYDYPDDFWDYEDAEDYWEDHQDD